MRRLRAGDWVVIRAQEEILATLDGAGRLEGLPFQPEMLAFCGRRMRVAKIAHKTCDSINKRGGLRMTSAVHLEGTRCDGSRHGGCQADCSFFWKEAWLRSADSPPPGVVAKTNGVCSEEIVELRVKAPGYENATDPVWVCQTTALLDATKPLPWWDLRQYVRDVTTRNHGFLRILRILAVAVYNRWIHWGWGYSAKIRLYDWVQRILGGKPWPVVRAHVGSAASVPVEALDLEPGEWVEVRSIEEIGDTLNERGMNRGLRYDPEMGKYSGCRSRVQMRVRRLIDEKTGRMLALKNPCIQLENIYCRAERTPHRLGCPRAMNTYWRETWLKRVTPPHGPARGSASAD